ncbi:MAG: hypothetical protein J6Y09_06905, partial [Lachnospiraceae bacterium]|nr:hypothetical protein [Lachnospiraceae bacterium]
MAMNLSKHVEVKDNPGMLYMTRRTMNYVFKVAWKEKKIIFFYYILKNIGYVLAEMKMLLLPKLLVDEIVAITEGAALEAHIKNAIFYVALTVLAESLSKLFVDTAETKIAYYSVFFERIFLYGLSSKSMSMDFEHTEDPTVLNQQNKATEGISWYSEGVTGMLDSFFNVIY